MVDYELLSSYRHMSYLLVSYKILNSHTENMGGLRLSYVSYLQTYELTMKMMIDDDDAMMIKMVDVLYRNRTLTLVLSQLCNPKVYLVGVLYECWIRLICNLQRLNLFTYLRFVRNPRL